MRPVSKKKAYAAAGVDIALGNQVKQGLQEKVQRTYGPEVLGRIGGFGGLFRAEFGQMKEPVLVSSIDGVGTKLKIAVALNSHESVAQDLVNHSINDIAVTGARPLFFLDYIGAERLDPEVFDQLISGFTKACKAGNCALIGGETAQLPDLYHHGEYDLAGCIVGVVDRTKILDGSRIVPSDVLLGLPSNGLHTNGFSLARKVLLQQMRLDLGAKTAGLTRPVGRIKAAAHITGGGLIDNIPRILPPTCDALLDSASWKVPPIFRLIQRGGNISVEEMFEVFNMGIGMVLVVARHQAEKVAAKAGTKVIGKITAGAGRVLLT